MDYKELVRKANHAAEVWRFQNPTTPTFGLCVDDMVHDLTTAINELLERAERAENNLAKSSWISTADRLPDVEEAEFFAQHGVHEFECQVAIDRAGVPTVLSYYDGEFFDEVTSYRVTHWAPLLKLPK